MIQWIRTSRLSIKESLSTDRMPGACVLHASVPVFPCHLQPSRTVTSDPPSLVGLVDFDFTACIHQLVLESQLSHRIVNLLFAIANEKIKKTDWGEVDFLQLINDTWCEFNLTPPVWWGRALVGVEVDGC